MIILLEIEIFLRQEGKFVKKHKNALKYLPNNKSFIYLQKVSHERKVLCLYLISHIFMKLIIILLYIAQTLVL